VYAIDLPIPSGAENEMMLLIEPCNNQFHERKFQSAKA
jgi:hypothetical protein